MKAFISSLPGVVDAIEASDEVRDAFVFAAWRHIAGDRTSERTCPVEVKERNLMVAVTDKTWKRNLESLAAQLLFKLNDTLGRSLIDCIEFQIEPDVVDFVPQGSAERSDAARESLPPEISISAQSIADKKLRYTVLKAAANCLARPN